MEGKTKILSVTAKADEPQLPREACLVHIYPTGLNMGKRYPLSDVILTIGREQDCAIQLEDDSVSRRHAGIRKEADDEFYVHDLQSTNGTFINDVKITEKRKLADGDYLRVGTTIYRFLAGGNLEAEYYEEIYRLDIFDGLTQIHNRRYLLEFLGRELSFSSRYFRPLAFLLLDIDQFKLINDRFSHLCGDFTLREVADRLRNEVRKEDLLARFGGEEFAVVLPETSREQALVIAERFRQRIGSQPFHFEDQTFSVTVSVGVSATTGNEWVTSAELIQQTDEKLYHAKQAGRNRVVG